MPMLEYQKVPASEVPDNLRWVTPMRHQGHIVEISYAQPGAAGDPGPGDLWMRVTDHSEPPESSTAYYKRTGK